MMIKEKMSHGGIMCRIYVKNRYTVEPKSVGVPCIVGGRESYRPPPGIPCYTHIYISTPYKYKCNKGYTTHY